MRNPSACTIVALALCAAASALPASGQARIHLAGEERPPVLERVGSPEGLSALVIAPGGERAAALLAPDEGAEKSTVLFFSTAAEQPASLELSGRLRDLVFTPDAEAVLGLLHRPAKKREGETYLVRIELEPPRARRIMRLPPSAGSLDFLPNRGILLVAARNEIRTLSYPGLRSGPLYRVAGENLAVASLNRGGLILVGQPEALLLIDLDAPPGERDMPVRERVETTQSVVSLAAAADGSRTLARLGDGTVHAVEFRPLRLAATGQPGQLAETGAPLGLSRPESPVATPEPPPAEPSPEGPETRGPLGAAPPEPESAPPPEPEGVPVPQPPGELVARPAQESIAAPQAPPEAAAEPTPAPPESVESSEIPQERGAEPPPPVATPGGAGPHAHQIQGSVGGPALAEVVAVVLLGPDNLLREALRVVPAEDGRWSADGLEPGRYRVLLDGGGKRVIVARPPYLLLEIRTGESIEAGEIQALRAF